MYGLMRNIRPQCLLVVLQEEGLFSSLPEHLAPSDTKCAEISNKHPSLKAAFSFYDSFCH